MISTRGEYNYPWPLILILALGVLLPTACVVWFMSEAMRNERFAVHQKLEDIYRQQLTDILRQFRDQWRHRVESVIQLEQEHKGAALFAAIVNRGLADSTIIYDGKGNTIYPELSAGTAAIPPPPQGWRQAEILEYQQQQWIGAAQKYAAIAERHSDIRWQAKARMAQARCLVKTGDFTGAIHLLTGTLKQAGFHQLKDHQGRFISAEAQFHALQIFSDRVNDPGPRQLAAIQITAGELIERLTDYQEPSMPAAQRLFLMREMTGMQRRVLGVDPVFPTIAAEVLAARYLDVHSADANDTKNSQWRLRETELSDIWQLAVGGDKVLLYTHETIVNMFAAMIETLPLTKDANIVLLPPAAPVTSEGQWLTLPMDNYLRGWRVELDLKEDSPFSTAAEKQIAAYLWTGVLIIAGILAIAVVTVHVIGKQIKNSRIKNDLVATVSHELKTPLSSIRLLVDTLLQNVEHYDITTRDYLQLIARENTRLSKLIDNFLTFSRMERNKQTFHFAMVSPAVITNRAVEAVAEKFKNCHRVLDVDFRAGLPRLMADCDLLVMALTNLLENACKYSGSSERVILRVYCEAGELCFAVQDFGIGISRRDRGKIFERFYRVDKNLAQEADGCGLGLNIVNVIASAHQGRITVESTLGEGSVFLLKIPLKINLEA